MIELFKSYSPEKQQIIFTKDLAEKYGLHRWGENFRLGTAGYRDLLDPAEFFSPQVPFNAVTMAIVAYARLKIAKKHGLKKLHIGGEVRPHTGRFIDLFARIYAAGGIEVHLRGDGPATTPIWLSSFGVFWHELDGGENFTASHSQSYKGGWKPMDENGMQLLSLAAEIEEEVHKATMAAVYGNLVIDLAAANDEKIHYDFNPLVPYISMLKLIVSQNDLDFIRQSLESGLRIAISSEGGSMGKTARMIFNELGFPLDSKGITFLHETESDNYHGIGVVDGVNHGVDPGKWQVYKNIGASDLLKTNQVDMVFIWDPDGDRFNIITAAPVSLKETAIKNGLETDPLDESRILVYFKPNQIYFMLTALKMESLKFSGHLNDYDWIAAITWPTSRSISEVAQKISIQNGKTVASLCVPVGFKYFGNMTSYLEKCGDETDGIIFKNAVGADIPLGKKPRIIMMAEESGGAACGTVEPFLSCNENRKSLALKEKDGMQIALMMLHLAALLRKENTSAAAHYLELLDKYSIKFRAYERQDITLYDESLSGEARYKAQKEANAKKDRIVNYFKNLCRMTPSEAGKTLYKITGMDEFQNVKSIYYAGDGTYIEFENLWFELRASGTDAVLRYYMEGQSVDLVHSLNSKLVSLNGTE
ncbi:hypothetical protein KKF34_19915 [Myxococcota bacterium]|nr:hypothetical protein [Myxococcota bacterium]MBU1380858.1 hypothetical protein [Myxococcota bacterium]MBU1499155.1 hypothetical protein [Myxococcota bacterium]